MKALRILLPVLFCTVGHAADVSLYAVTKAQFFKQTSTAAPTILPTAGYAFASVVDASGAGTVSSATLKLPDASVRNFGPVSGVGQLAVAQTFNTETALDTTFASGAYQFTINAVNDGTKTPTLNLPASAYPNTPTITNFTAAQNIDWTQNFTLTWGAFVGGNALDTIQVTIRRKNGTTAFSTPGFGQSGALNGTATSATVPAGTFAPGETCTGTLYFGNVINVDLTSYGLLLGVPGVTAFIKTTEFTMRAPGTDPELVIAETTPGTFELAWSTDIGRTYDVRWSEDLETWNPIGLVVADSAIETVTDTPPTSTPKRFYRLQDPP